MAKWFLQKGAVIIIALVLLWFTGVGDIITRNPALLLFGIIGLIIVFVMGGKK